MTIGLLSFALMQGVAWLLNAAVRPHRRVPQSAVGGSVHALVLTALFGGFLALSGSAPVSSVLTLALMTVFVVASNAKHVMLGEPLSFSDLALFAAMVRHPGFYLTALSTRQQVAFVVGTVAVLLGLGWLFIPDPASHLAGAGVVVVALSALFLLVRSRVGRHVARTPDLDADLAKHGLIAVLLLYWRRWRESIDPPTCTEMPSVAGAPAALDLVLVVQCESFADPVALTGDSRFALPGLARARSLALQWGDLSVSGFGAYTMRTEFGVLFGRSEAALGFRRYDPFLTARGEATYAIPARLRARGYQSLFVHPHDLRFYGRDRLMPAIGFDRLIGETHFPTATPGNGRYVEDRAVATALAEVIGRARKPTFVYTVTMENHGPWRKDRITGSPGGLDTYLHHLRNSDAMLTELMDHLIATRSSALLVFFGDHRPSIPGIVEPGAERHTPYVMLRFADGKPIPGDGAAHDLTPDELHHAILGAA